MGEIEKKETHNEKRFPDFPCFRLPIESNSRLGSSALGTETVPIIFMLTGLLFLNEMVLWVKKV